MTIDDILSRRSVRQFKARTVTDEEIQQLLEAGMAAPSACCRDPWEILVLKSPEALKKAAEALPNGKFLASAGVGFIVCGDPANAHAESLSYLIQDCSAVIENILLTATVLGLGGCWLGIHPREERIAALRKSFNIPANVIPVGAIALGEPIAVPEKRTRFNASKIHLNSWQGR